MEKLRELGIDPNVPKSECLSALVTQSVEILLLDLRTCLFNHADEKSLVTRVMNWSVADSHGLVNP